MTIADVAERAGVAKSTASLAFRAEGPIVPSTRERVLAAAAELGYSGPHPTASSLRSGRSGVIGVVIAGPVSRSFHNPVAISTMDGLSESLERVGHGLLLLPGASYGSDRPELMQALPLDAVVFATRGEEVDSLLPVARARQLPIVGIEGPHAEDVALVEVDNVGGMAQLASHVAELGHRHIGVVMRTTRLGEDRPPGRVEPVGARLEQIENRTIRQRLEAVETVFPEAIRVEAGGREFEAGAAAAEVFLDLPEPPTALMAQNDLLAMGAMAAAHSRGLRVPEDLTVTGFDGIEVPWSRQRLTTVRQPLRERGRRAGELVASLLAGGAPERVVMPVGLELGETSAPPRSG